MGDFGVRDEFDRKCRVEREDAAYPPTVKFDRRRRRDTGPRDTDLRVGMEVLLLGARGSIVSAHVVEIEHATRSRFDVQCLQDGRASKILTLWRKDLYRVDCSNDLKRLAGDLLTLGEKCAAEAERIGERAEDLALKG